MDAKQAMAQAEAPPDYQADMPPAEEEFFSGPLRADFIRPLPRGDRDRGPAAGLGAGLVLLRAAIALGGTLRAYADLPAFLMVFGGTLAVTAVSFSIADMLDLPKALATTIIEALPDRRA